MFDPIYNAIGWALAQLYAFYPNFGVSIILLTLLIMFALFPLTAKQAKSMIAMQRVQPEIKKLQAKHKGDRQKLNEEMMKFYQENKINPLAGCLPLVIQMPVFFALFRVLRQPYSHLPKTSSLFHAFCGSDNGPASQVVHACGHTKGLPHHLEFAWMDLSLKATAHHASLIDGLPYFLLVGFVLITGVLQSQQTTRNSPPGANQQMQMVGKVLPIAFGFFSLVFPAGLVLYFFVSNLWRLGQQELIYRKIAPPLHTEKGGGAVDVKSSEPSSSGGGLGGGGGLRNLFKIPPAVGTGDDASPANADKPKPAPKPAPKAEDGAKTPPKPSASAKRGQSRSGGGAGQARRRSNKKKRKR